MDSSITLADALRLNPEAAKTFHDHGFEFACKGDMTIGEAARQKGIDANSVVRALIALPKVVDCDKQLATISDIIDNILAVHHSYLWRELPEILELLGDLSTSLPDNKEVAESLALFTKIKGNIDKHSTEEEQTVFPSFKQLDSRQPEQANLDELSSRLAEMENEHSNCSGALKKLRALNCDYNDSNARSEEHGKLMARLKRLELDLNIHIHKENNLLHPLVKGRIRELSVNEVSE